MPQIEGWFIGLIIATVLTIVAFALHVKSGKNESVAALLFGLLALAIFIVILTTRFPVIIEWAENFLYWLTGNF